MISHDKLALGTVQFGMSYGVANTSGRVNSREASKILEYAKTCGLDTLDTAIGYGESEAVLGQLGIQSWRVVTKLPAVPDDCPDIQQWVQDETRHSIARLGVTRLHGVLLHRPSQLLNHMGPALYDGLQVLKAQGLTDKIGVSVYGPAELDVLFDAYPCDLVQAPLSILDRRLVDSGWARRLHNAEVEVHTRSAFLQGLLLMFPSRRPAKFMRWTEVWNEWDRWLAEMSITPLQACLRYFNMMPDIDRVVVGVDSVSQLAQIIEAADGELVSLPEFDFLQDERLINPATWSQL